MDEKELKVIEANLRSIERQWSATGIEYAPALTAEIRRLWTRLEETENLLARAVIDSHAYGLGVAAERGRMLRELEGFYNRVEVKGFREQTIFELMGWLDNSPGALVEPLPPERLRERIRELEDALEPLAKLVHRMDSEQQEHPGYLTDQTAVWILGLHSTNHFVVGDSDHFTAEQVRRAARALAKEE